MTLWFEEIPLGESFPLGHHTFSEQAIIDFARKYDNQYFHTDPVKAKQSRFGSLVASGWHTASVGQRLMVDMVHNNGDKLRAEGREPGVSGPGLGVNVLEFFAPVRPGDTLTYTITTKDKRKSNSIPGWGILVSVLEATNQDGVKTYRCELPSLSKLRDYTPTRKEKFFLALSQLPLIGKPLIRLIS